MKTFNFYDVLMRYSVSHKIEAIIIGAMDGVSHDTIKEFVNNPNWSLIFVESVTYYL